MAKSCQLCGKQIGFFDGSYSVAGLTICESCYFAYIKVLDSVSDAEKFEVSLKEFYGVYGDEEGIEKIIDHLMSLHKASFEEYQENSERRETKNISVETVENDDDNCNNGYNENQGTSQTVTKNKIENNSTSYASNSGGMFSNIGVKIKNFALTATCLGIIGSMIYGFIIMLSGAESIITGLLVAICGSLGSWVSSFVIYGFGQLVDNTDKIVELLKDKGNKHE